MKHIDDLFFAVPPNKKIRSLLARAAVHDRKNGVFENASECIWPQLTSLNLALHAKVRQNNAPKNMFSGAFPAKQTRRLLARAEGARE